MNINRKLINVLCFVIILILGFAVLYKLRAINMVQEGPEVSSNISYVLILFIIVVSFAQAILNLMIKEKEKEKEKEIEVVTTEEKLGKKENKETAEEKRKNEIKAEEKQSTIDSKEILGRIIPQKLPSLEEFCETLLINLSKEFEIVQGIFYTKNLSEEVFSSIAFYAYFADEKPEDFKEGETLPGQVARNKEVLQIGNIPEKYIKIISGLGESEPGFLIFIPIIKDEMTIGIIEIASFIKFDDEYIDMFEMMGNKLTMPIYNYIKGTEKTKNDKKETK